MFNTYVNDGFIQGALFGWKQEDCDETFRQGMLKICSTKSDKEKRSVPGDAIYKRGSWTDWLGKWWNDFVIWQKLKDGWKKATANATSAEEIQRLWEGTKELFWMLKEWSSHKTDKAECEHAVKIYFKTLQTIGIYSFRQTSPSYCNQKCAEVKGKPTHTAQWHKLKKNNQ